MKSLIANITGGYSSSASVIDNNLIISLPDANAPVVWRMDLSKVKTSSLEVRTDKDGLHVLIFKTEKGEDEDIAPFDNRSKAVKALMVVSSAMQNAETSQQRVAANAESQPHATGQHTHSKEKNGSKLLSTLIGLGVLGLLIYVLFNMSPNVPVSTETSTAAQSGSFSGEQSLEETGVPQSADSFLMGR
jgi:hypothetical protein